MLTKTDLVQIRKIVRGEIESESQSIKKELQGEIKLLRIELQQDIRSLTNRIKNLEVAIAQIQKDIKSRVEEDLKLPPLQ